MVRRSLGCLWESSLIWGWILLDILKQEYLNTVYKNRRGRRMNGIPGMLKAGVKGNRYIYSFEFFHINWSLFFEFHIIKWIRRKINGHSRLHPIFNTDPKNLKNPSYFPHPLSPPSRASLKTHSRNPIHPNTILFDPINSTMSPP